MTSETIRVGVVFEGEMAHRFKLGKKHHGIESNSDFLRYLISMEAERVGRVGIENGELKNDGPEPSRKKKLLAFLMVIFIITLTQGRYS